MKDLLCSLYFILLLFRILGKGHPYYNLNILSLMYQQYTAPVLTWSNNLILDLCETSRFHVSLKSNYPRLTFLLIYQTSTITMILKCDH